MKLATKLSFVLLPVILLISVSGSLLFAQDLRVRISPSQLTVGVDDTFTVNVMVKNVTNLGAFQFDITYNTDVVHVNSAQMGDFLGSTGRTVVPVGPDIDNTSNPGKLTFGGATFGTAAGPDGSGVLATVEFWTQGQANAILDLENVQISDINGQTQTVSSIGDGLVTVFLAFDTYTHTAPDFWNSISNSGWLANMWVDSTGMEWPGGSRQNHLYNGALWVGAVIGNDTLVSSQHYLNYEWTPFQKIQTSSNISNEDTYCSFTDTVTSVNPNPLGLMVIQESYAWNNESFIIFKYNIKNLGWHGNLTGVYVGLFSDFDIQSSIPDQYWSDDLPGYDETNYISYMYDNDGDGGQSTGYVGLKLLNHTPSAHTWLRAGEDPQSDGQMFQLISREDYMSAPTEPSDHRIIQSAGPFNIADGDSLNIWFALAIGDGLSGLQAACQAAQTKYEDVLVGVDDRNHVQTRLPERYALFQNYPNPFNPETIIKYQLPEASHVSLRVFDILGNEVRTLVENKKKSGEYQVIWDGRDNRGKQVASGIYFYQLQAGDFVSVRKMLYLE